MGTDIFNIGYSTSRRERIEDLINDSKYRYKKRERDIGVLGALFISDPSEKNFNNLVKRIKIGLDGYIKKIVKEDDAVNEVMSRTLENIYFNRDKFCPDVANFSTWVYRIAYVNSVKYLRGEYGYGGNSDYVDSPVEFDGEEDKFIDYCNNNVSDTDVAYDDFDIVYENGKYRKYTFDELACDVYDASVKCISVLPDKYRVILTDRLLHNKKVEDIAVAYKISVPRVKNYIRSAKAMLEDDIKYKYPNLCSLYMIFLNDKK